MDSSKMEVGDVVRHNDREVNVSEVMEVYLGQGTIRAVKLDGAWVSSGLVELVRKADPYHNISLPAPPAGYRLAKWGEELSMGALWWSSMTRTWGDEGGDTETRWMLESPHMSIFAIPLDQPSPIKSWQFRESPWVVPEPKTLADVPENTPCIAYHTEDLYVTQRVGVRVMYLKAGFVEGSQSAYEAKAWKFVRYLDTPPQKPLSLDDVPDGRCILVGGDLFWRSPTGNWMRRSGEFIRSATGAGEFTDFTVTNYIAEFRGPA